MTDNFLYKVIDIPNEEEMKNEFRKYFLYFKDHCMDTDDYLHKISLEGIENFSVFNQWAAEKDLKLRTAAFVLAQGRSWFQNSIHIDSAPATVALNFGLTIPEGSYTGLYEQISGSILENQQKNGVMRKIFVGGRFKEICRFDLSKATLFNTQVPHGIFTPLNTTRLTITFRFFNNLLDVL